MNKNLQAFAAFLFVFLVMVASQSAHAAYVTTPAVDGLGAGTYRPLTIPALTGSNFSATGKVWINGKMVPIPGYIPPASTAAAAARNSLWLNPWLVGLSLLGWSGDAGLNSDSGMWMFEMPPEALANPNLEYQVGVDPWNASPLGACVSGWRYPQCGAVSRAYGGTCYVNYVAGCGVPVGENPWTAYKSRTASVCPVGYTGYPTSGTCVLTDPVAAGGVSRPAIQPDFDALPAPPPEALAELAPQVGVPVDDPVFEPATVTVGSPYTKPDGSTAQPMAKITPAGDGQVAIDTYDQPISDSDGIPYPAPPPPEDTPETAPSETQCDKYPNSLGCAELGTVDDITLPDETRSIAAIAPVSVGGAGSCPAPLTATFMGQTVSFSYDMPCQFATSLKPLILAIAWLSAGLIFIGGVRQ